LSDGRLQNRLQDDTVVANHLSCPISLDQFISWRFRFMCK